MSNSSPQSRNIWGDNVFRGIPVGQDVIPLANQFLQSGKCSPPSSIVILYHRVQQHFCLDVFKRKRIGQLSKQTCPATKQDRKDSDDHFIDQVFLQEALNRRSSVNVEFLVPLLLESGNYIEQTARQSGSRVGIRRRRRR